jgi:hypothetical protein
MADPIFLLFGILVGGVGSLVGVGGGIIVVPYLLLTRPELSHREVSSISILVVLGNALSGSLRVAFQKRIHWKAAWLFSLASIPGAWFGVSLSGAFNRSDFVIAFVAFVALLGVAVLVRAQTEKLIPYRSPKALESLRVLKSRHFVLGSIASCLIGGLASFMGVGGGLLQVPMLSILLSFPIHLATGTSLFILTVTSFVAVASHFWLGGYASLPEFVIYLIVGAVMGAQLGTRFAVLFSPRLLLQWTGFSLILMAVSLFFQFS